MTSSGIVFDDIQKDLEDIEVWPSDAQLFQPYDGEQILLPDNANCLAVQAFLHMCNLEFTIEMRTNAEFMSPSGRVPFIKAGRFVIADFNHIITFVHNKKVSLSEALDKKEKADMTAYMSMVSNVLGCAEAYVTWIHPETLEEVTRPRYSSVFPWPINKVITWQKRRRVLKELDTFDWATKSLDQVYEDVEACCNSLSDRLGNQRFFFGDRPTELDALVYGHLFTILTTPLPDNRLSVIVRGFKNLVGLCERVDKEFFESH